MSNEEQELEHTPAWLASAIDQRVAQLKQALGAAIDNLDYTVVLLSLTDPPALGQQFWEQSCDHCKRHFPEGKGLLVGSIARTLKPEVLVEITFGTCHDCIVLP